MGRCAADGPFYQALVMSLGMWTSLLIPARFLRGRRNAQASRTLYLTGLGGTVRFWPNAGKCRSPIS